MAAGGLVVLIALLCLLPRLTLVGDNLLRRKIDQILPALSADIRELEFAPRLRRRKRYFSAILVGLSVALYAAFFAGDTILDHRPTRAFAEGDWDTIAMVFFAAFFPVSLGVAYWLRGGQLELRPEGPLFIYRGQTVACPWELFRSDVEPKWLGAFTLVVPVHFPAVPRVVQTNRDGSTVSGKDVTSPPCRPWNYAGKTWTEVPDRNWEFLMDDLYECELPEVIALLRRIAEQVSPPDPSQSSLA
jgi:hypothetical protein